MDLKLKYTEHYALLVEVKPIFTVGDYVLENVLEKDIIINIFPNYLGNLCECDKIIAYLPIHLDAKELDLPLLPPMTYFNELPIEFTPSIFYRDPSGEILYESNNNSEGKEVLIGTYYI